VSNILQEVRGVLNNALNTSRTPPVAPVGGIAPVIHLGGIDGTDPVFNRGYWDKDSIAAPGAGTSIVASPALQGGAYDVIYQISTDIQTAIATISLRLAQPVGGTNLGLFTWRIQNGDILHQKGSVSLVVEEGQNLHIRADTAMAGSVNATIAWRRRVINPR